MAFAFFICLPICSFAQNKVLNLYIWKDYVSKTTIPDFERKFGVKVVLKTYLDELEMQGELLANPGKYDLCITSDAKIKELIMTRVIDKIDIEKIPNVKYLYKEFLGQWFDSKNEYSIPYVWGSTGIVVNKKYVDVSKGFSLKLFWDVKNKGRIALINDRDEAIGLALKSQNLSINSYEPDMLNAAGNKLIDLVDNNGCLMLDYEALMEKLINEELWIGQIYSGEGVRCVSKNSNLAYVYPIEGCPKWIDSFIIPRDAPNRELAHKFINFIHEPEKYADIINYIKNSGCNKAAEKYVLPEILNNKMIYPDREIFEKSEVFIRVKQEKYAKGNQIRNKFWSKIQIKVLKKKN